MSDELDRRLRESLSDLQLPAAPSTLHDAIDRLEAGPVTRRRTQGRSIIAAVAVLIVAVVVVAVFAWGTGPRLGAGPSSTRPGSVEVSVKPAETTPPTSAPRATEALGGPLITTDNGLSMLVTLSSSEVAPGGSVTIDIAIRNDRPVPVPISSGHCGALATMYAVLPVPLDPVGRDWDGIAGTFKHYALTEGLREGGAPMSQPGWVYANAAPCKDPSPDVALEPGGTMSGSMTWSALLVKGVPALPGEVPFNVSVAHDPSGALPSYPPGYKGPIASWFKTYQQLTVTGTIRIVGDAPAVLSGGQAIDAMLSNQPFTNWLTEQPASTWSVANVFLQNPGKAQGIVPAGPSWDVELFREVGVPRTWAIGYVDAFSGKVLSLTFCVGPSESGPGGSCVNSRA
jgi:hypothetical protein